MVQCKASLVTLPSLAGAGTRNLAWPGLETHLYFLFSIIQGESTTVCFITYPGVRTCCVSSPRSPYKLTMSSPCTQRSASLGSASSSSSR